MSRLLIIATVSMLLAGCGSANSQVKHSASSPSADLDVPPKAEKEITELHRGDLNKLLEGGPASVLAMVQTDSHMSNGRFAGFSIVAFRVTPPAFFDLREGDVVTKINDLPIERPGQYFKVFEALKTAAELKLDILRDNEVKTLIYPILP